MAHAVVPHSRRGSRRLSGLCPSQGEGGSVPASSVVPHAVAFLTPRAPFNAMGGCYESPTFLFIQIEIFTCRCRSGRQFMRSARVSGLSPTVSAISPSQGTRGVGSRPPVSRQRGVFNPFIAWQLGSETPRHQSLMLKCRLRVRIPVPVPTNVFHLFNLRFRFLPSPLSLHDWRDANGHPADESPRTLPPDSGARSVASW